MVGKTISHYKVLENIGLGGLGKGWQARDTELGREVAIKRLPRVRGHPDCHPRFGKIIFRKAG